MNRAEFRRGGLQGRKHSTLTGKEWEGRKIGSFLGRTPALSNYAKAYRRATERSRRFLMQEPLRSPGRTRAKRNAARARAA